MRRSIVPLLLVVIATALALHAGFPSSICLTGAAFAQEPAKDQPKAPTPASPSPIEPTKEPTLKAGMPAPELKVENWVKGEPVTTFQSGKVYAVLFWATYAKPCEKAIVYMTGVKRKNKGLLEVAAVAAYERIGKNEPDKRLENLIQYVADRTNSMDYSVAYDGNRTSVKDWMEPAGLTTIPTVFIIGADGKIAWIGNPLVDMFDTKLDMAIADAKRRMSQ